MNLYRVTFLSRPARDPKQPWRHSVFDPIAAASEDEAIGFSETLAKLLGSEPHPAGMHAELSGPETVTITTLNP